MCLFVNLIKTEVCKIILVLYSGSSTCELTPRCPYYNWSWLLTGMSKYRYCIGVEREGGHK